MRSMHLRLSILALLTITGVAFVWLLWEPGTPSEATREELALNEELRNQQPVVPAQDGNGDFVRSETTTSQPVGSADQEPAQAITPEPVRSGLHIVGRLTNEEGEGLCNGKIEARARYVNQRQWTEFGTGVTSGSGEFAIPLKPPAGLPPARWDAIELELVFRAEGRVPELWSGALADAEDEVINVGEYTLENGDRVVLGRVLSPDGNGVVDAQIHLIAWGSTGANMNSAFTESTANGDYWMSDIAVGHFDLFASHPRFGIARLHGVIDERLESRQLGDLVLQPTNPISGRVLAIDGTPLEGVIVEAKSVDEDRGENHETTTDFEGRFAFRALGGGAFHIQCWMIHEDAVLAAPGTRDLVIRSAYPTCVLRTVGADGAELRDVSYRIIRAGHNARAGDAADDLVRDQLTTRRGELIVLHRPVEIRVTAFEFVADERFLCSILVTLRRAHQEVELRLEREECIEVRLKITTANGVPLTAYNSTAFSVEEDGVVGSANGSLGVLRVRPQTLDLYISPDSSTFAVPFSRTVHIKPNDRELALQADTMGGNLHLQLYADVELKSSYHVSLVNSGGNAIATSLHVDKDGLVTNKEVMRPGSYTARATMDGAEPLDIPFEIQAGTTTHLTAVLRAAAPRKGR